MMSNQSIEVAHPWRVHETRGSSVVCTISGRSYVLHLEPYFVYFGDVAGIESVSCFGVFFKCSRGILAAVVFHARTFLHIEAPQKNTGGLEG